MARDVFSFDRNWLYGGRVVRGCTDPGFDDSGFERVTIPHTNRVFSWHGFDDEEYRFVSIYRRHFTLPDVPVDRRVFVDFEGVMAAATVTLNGETLGEHRGGYTPFSFEISGRVRWGEDNVLAVEVDSTEREDIPPFGGNVDYLTFGGIYREVALRIVPDTFIENVFAKPVDVLGEDRRVEVRCFLNGRDAPKGPSTLTAELRDGVSTVASASCEVKPEGEGSVWDLVLGGIGPVELWDTENPKLYEVVVRLHEGGECSDEYIVRVGFREAWFTPDGFFLNGRRFKLRGLNRHQTYPYVGAAMPARVQRRDALILKNELKCNVIRTSHYPQSKHFLDCCDETGLLVFEEIPGWQHIGDEGWKDLACRDVEDMVRRDWNRPSIILWGVRINESQDDHDFYTRTNRIAHTMDDSRQTSGVRYFFESELLEDVFGMNDFDPDIITPPHHPLYLNTEFAGHMFPTKPIDNAERTQEHALRHARVHDMLGADDRFAGGIGWCAFDYNTHANFGSGDRVCYHGVSDIFRIAKLAAGFYKSQCDPEEKVVLEPGFHWSSGDQSDYGGHGEGAIFSNCDRLVVYIGDELQAELAPDRERFGNLSHPPFFFSALSGIAPWRRVWGDLRIDGYLSDRKVASRTLSSKGVDQRFSVEPDDTKLLGDGIDATRVVLRVTDEFGSPRPFATGAVALEIEGPGEIVGENPFALFGGVGAVWVRTRAAEGDIVLRAKHPVLGTRTIRIEVKGTSSDAVEV
ncbi:MAG: glycoside hydrolase family 2 TIM barrel-domain containing protein [Rubrobacteraceae bacterium]